MRRTFRTVQSARARMIAALFGGFIAACAHSAQQDGAPGFPARPIRFIVPFTAGAGADITARTIAAKLSDILSDVRSLTDIIAGSGARGEPIAAGKAA